MEDCNNIVYKIYLTNLTRFLPDTKHLPKFLDQQYTLYILHSLSHTINNRP